MKNEFPVKKMIVCDIEISNYVVVCTKDLDVCVEKAVTTLTEMIRKAVGHELKVIDDGEEATYEIVIGTTNRDTEPVKQIRASLKKDGYAIVAEGNRLFIIGNNARGVSYGVYSLLEDWLGVRFYASDYTVIHEADLIEVPKDVYVVDNPHFEFRDVCWYDYIQNHDFAMANKMNVAEGQRTDVSDTGMYAGPYVHTLSALSGGPDQIIDNQPCLTDETVYQTVLSNVRKRLAENPAASIISVSQNDSYAEGVGCQCSKCRAIDEAEGTPMGSLLTFVNRIASEIKDEYPNVRGNM